MPNQPILTDENGAPVADNQHSQSAGPTGSTTGSGASRTYTYDFVAEGAPTRAAMHWYHDHRLDNTGRNNWRGLAGMWITDDALDASLPLPTGARVRQAIAALDAQRFQTRKKAQEQLENWRADRRGA